MKWRQRPLKTKRTKKKEEKTLQFRFYVKRDFIMLCYVHIWRINFEWKLDTLIDNKDNNYYYYFSKNSYFYLCLSLCVNSHQQCNLKVECSTSRHSNDWLTHSRTSENIITHMWIGAVERIKIERKNKKRKQIIERKREKWKRMKENFIVDWINQFKAKKSKENTITQCRVHRSNCLTIIAA